VVAAGTATVAAGATVNGTLVATDAEGGALTYTRVVDGTKGSATVNTNGSFTYTATAGTSGTDTFSFKANDGAIDSNVATVIVTITAAGAPPLAAADPDSDSKCGVGGGIGVLVLGLLLAFKNLFIARRTR
jgi:VCBS repeat-containing protein